MPNPSLRRWSRASAVSLTLLSSACTSVPSPPEEPASPVVATGDDLVLPLDAYDLDAAGRSAVQTTRYKLAVLARVTPSCVGSRGLGVPLRALCAAGGHHQSEGERGYRRVRKDLHLADDPLTRHSTARTAFQKGFHVTVLTDCTAGLHLPVATSCAS
ncbi:hypothetical protein ACOZ38_32930 [Sphaerisporangium viridialbum]|uniref:hypothetical protein n=1 Tax=Sphaerisporangium viridialbum TaxID=46189 RepID=UPI003C748C08